MSGHPRSLFQVVAFREVGSILEFPVWWYSRGIGMLFEWAQEGLAYSWKEKAFGLWARNLFTPMYGDRSWSGRSLSVALRIAVLFGRGIAFLAQIWAYLLMVVVWILLPLVAIILLVFPTVAAALRFFVT